MTRNFIPHACRSETISFDVPVKGENGSPEYTGIHT
jgi:hypothetical protein